LRAGGTGWTFCIPNQRILVVAAILHGVHDAGTARFLVVAGDDDLGCGGGCGRGHCGRRRKSQGESQGNRVLHVHWSLQVGDHEEFQKNEADKEYRTLVYIAAIAIINQILKNFQTILGTEVSLLIPRPSDRQELGERIQAISLVAIRAASSFVLFISALIL